LVRPGGGATRGSLGYDRAAQDKFIIAPLPESPLVFKYNPAPKTVKMANAANAFRACDLAASQKLDLTWRVAFADVQCDAICGAHWFVWGALCSYVFDVCGDQVPTRDPCVGSKPPNVPQALRKWGRGKPHPHIRGACGELGGLFPTHGSLVGTWPPQKAKNVFEDGAPHTGQ
jgi:hypothetical protein